MPFLAQCIAIVTHLLLHAQRGIHSSLGMIFVSDGRTEQSKNAITEHLVDVYVDHHRPTWFIAWNVELLWRNEAPFSFPTMAVDVFAAKSLILQQPRKQLEPYLDLPWFKGDEYQIQKLAFVLNH